MTTSRPALDLHTEINHHICNSVTSATLWPRSSSIIHVRNHGFFLFSQCWCWLTMLPDPSHGIFLLSIETNFNNLGSQWKEGPGCSLVSLSYISTPLYLIGLAIQQRHHQIANVAHPDGLSTAIFRTMMPMMARPHNDDPPPSTNDCDHPPPLQWATSAYLPQTATSSNNNKRRDPPPALPPSNDNRRWASTTSTTTTWTTMSDEHPPPALPLIHELGFCAADNRLTSPGNPCLCLDSAELTLNGMLLCMTHIPQHLTYPGQGRCGDNPGRQRCNNDAGR